MVSEEKGSTLQLSEVASSTPLHNNKFELVLSEGPGKGQVVNLDIMLDEYYMLRGWNKNGIPTPDTLTKLGLMNV